MLLFFLKFIKILYFLSDIEIVEFDYKHLDVAKVYVKFKSKDVQKFKEKLFKKNDLVDFKKEIFWEECEDDLSSQLSLSFFFSCLNLLEFA